MGAHALTPTNTDDQRAANLVALLTARLPEELERLAAMPWNERYWAAHKALPALMQHADALQYADDGDDAAASLVTIVAVLALQPGGVDAFGRHWCAHHALCRAVEHAIQTSEDEATS